MSMQVQAVTTTSRRWAPLLVLLSGTFMVILDFFIVNVAVPELQADLGASPAEIQLVVAGYGLTYAAGLIVGGRVGDLFGRRRVFSIGMAGFVVASLACGLAPSITALIVARVLQGATAAVMAPQVLTLLGVVFTDSDRDWAFAAYGITLGLASGAGQLLGGALIDLDVVGLRWRGCFLVNVPVGLAALACARRFVPESRGGGPRRLDMAGATLVTIGMAALVVPLIEGRERGWPAWTWVCLAVALACLAAFVRHERAEAAAGRAPLVHPGLFARRSFAVGIVTIVAFYSGVASFFLILSLYLQQGQGLEPFASGVVFSVMIAGFLVTTFAGRPIASRLGTAALPVGALVITAGHLGLRASVLGIGTGGSVWALTPALLVTGAGTGIVMGPIISRVLAAADPAHAGAASGVLAASQQLGNSLGVALIGIVYFGLAGPDPSRSSIVDATATSHLWLAGLGVVVAALLAALPRTVRSAA